MSVQSALGNIYNNVSNDIQVAINGARTTLGNIVGSLSAKLSSMWDGGFAGIDENNLSTLTEALEKYCKDISDQIEAFNQSSTLEVAYKGAIQDAAIDFVDAVKKILEAYVSTMRRNIAEAGTAFQNYKQGAQAISQSVVTDAQDIRAKASEIKLD